MFLLVLGVASYKPCGISSSNDFSYLLFFFFFCPFVSLQFYNRASLYRALFYETLVCFKPNETVEVFKKKKAKANEVDLYGAPKGTIHSRKLVLKERQVFVHSCSREI